MTSRSASTATYSPQEAGGGRPVGAAELLAQPGQLDRADAALGGAQQQVAQLGGEGPGAQRRAQVVRPADRVVLGLLADHVEQLADDQILLGTGEQPGRRLAALGGGPAQQPERVRREGAHQRLAHAPGGRRGDPGLDPVRAARWRRGGRRSAPGSAPGRRPRSTRAATASTSVLVLPVPGPPSTSSGPSVCATTSACTGSARQPSPGARRRTMRRARRPARRRRPPRPGRPPASARAGRRTNRYACISSIPSRQYDSPTAPPRTVAAPTGRS